VLPAVVARPWVKSGNLVAGPDILR
jgi:hypothetical protein